jgi:hypothetical protein
MQVLSAFFAIFQADLGLPASRFGFGIAFDADFVKLEVVFVRRGENRCTMADIF